jgi:hypothetical protein
MKLPGGGYAPQNHVEPGTPPTSPAGASSAQVAPRVLAGEVVSVPVEAKAAAKALRTAATWLPDEYRDMLREAADGAEKDWDGSCCPVCQEVWCDGGCPLETVRANLMKGQS